MSYVTNKTRIKTTFIEPHILENIPYNNMNKKKVVYYNAIKKNELYDHIHLMFDFCWI